MRRAAVGNAHALRGGLRAFRVSTRRRTPRGGVIRLLAASTEWKQNRDEHHAEKHRCFHANDSRVQFRSAFSPARRFIADLFATRSAPLVLRVLSLQLLLELRIIL